MTTSQSVITSVQRVAPTTFRIIPAGAFSADDGRENGKWFLSESNARVIINTVAQRADDYLIDYEHHSLNNEKIFNPAAGWFKKLEWRPDGLYVVDARWTPKARAMIEGDEYRYISPVFNFNAETGMVTSLHSVALTNTPALHGLADLSLAAATAQLSPGSKSMTAKELENYRAWFGGTPEELQEYLNRSEAKPNMPNLEGKSERDRDVFTHHFGHLFK